MNHWLLCRAAAPLKILSTKNLVSYLKMVNIQLHLHLLNYNDLFHFHRSGGGFITQKFYVRTKINNLVA